MKIMAVLLSVYFLALNFAPCSDFENSTDNAQIETLIGFDGDYDQGTTDLCSPFCQCHCCHVHTVDFGIDGIEPLVAGISSEIFTHLDNSGKDIVNPILQPPRV
jgi:uncharacterized protein DUF6660